jgi:DNA-binding XRE family transcriptional regulator
MAKPKTKRAKSPGSLKAAKGGDLLSSWRKKQKMNQRDFAEKVGVRQGTVCDWEGGKHMPRIGQALKIETLTGKFVPVRSWQTAA